MVGCIGNLYESVENLNETYILQPERNKDLLLKPRPAMSAVNAPLLTAEEANASATYYMCSTYHRYVTDNPSAICPICVQAMATKISYVAAINTNQGSSSNEGGYVKGVVTYMVMDNLTVMPMSTISGITLLTKFNVGNVNLLEEKVVEFGVDEGLELLKVSLQSKTALSDVFLAKKA